LKLLQFFISTDHPLEQEKKPVSIIFLSEEIALQLLDKMSEAISTADIMRGPELCLEDERPIHEAFMREALAMVSLP
jgi:hypothetical protein